MQTKEKERDIEPLVSIIVPVYNAEQYLEICIESLINQSYHNIEIILVDDASKDLSPQICDKYAKIDGRVKVIHKKNGGAAAARKSGVSISTGNFVIFVDADDWIEQDMIDVMFRKQIDYCVDVVICNFYRDRGHQISSEEMFFEEGYYNKKMLETKIYPRMVYAGSFGKFGIVPSLCGKFFKASLLKQAIVDAPDDVSLGDDATVLYPLMLQAEQCYIMNIPLYHYRVNEKSMTLSFNKRQTLDTINVIKYLREQFTEYEKYNLEFQLDAYHLFITMRNIVNIGLAGFTKGYRKRISEFKRYIHITCVYDIFGHRNIKSIEVSKKVKLGILLLKIHCPGLLVFVYCIKSIIKQRKR